MNPVHEPTTSIRIELRTAIPTLEIVKALRVVQGRHHPRIRVLLHDTLVERVLWEDRGRIRVGTSQKQHGALMWPAGLEWTPEGKDRAIFSWADLDAVLAERASRRASPPPPPPPRSSSTPKRRSWDRNVRLRVYRRGRGVCYLCGIQVTSVEGARSYGTLDHVVPLARGGADEESNLALACYGCNQDKADLMPPQGLHLPRAPGSFTKQERIILASTLLNLMTGPLNGHQTSCVCGTCTHLAQSLDTAARLIREGVPPPTEAPPEPEAERPDDSDGC